MGADEAAMDASEDKRSPWRRLADAVFGYDYFISYAWSDGGVYATNLAEALRRHGFECFLDTQRYRVGDDWRKIGRWTLRQTSSLIIVGSPNAVSSEPVLYELSTFQRFNNRVVPIDFAGTLDYRPDGPPLLQRLPEPIIRLKEARTCLETGPSDGMIRRLHDDFKGIKQAQWRTRLLAVPPPDDDEQREAAKHSVTIWDVQRPSSSIRMEWGDSTSRASFGGLRAESRDSGLVELYQADERPGEPAVLEAPGSRHAPSLAFSPDGSYLLTMSKPSTRFDVNRTLRLQVSSTAALAGLVCVKVRRNLTREEWRRFVGPAVAYERTCGDSPVGP